MRGQSAGPPFHPAVQPSPGPESSRRDSAHLEPSHREPSHRDSTHDHAAPAPRHQRLTRQWSRHDAVTRCCGRRDGRVGSPPNASNDLSHMKSTGNFSPRAFQYDVCGGVDFQATRGASLSSPVGPCCRPPTTPPPSLPPACRRPEPRTMSGASPNRFGGCRVFSFEVFFAVGSCPSSHFFPPIPPPFPPCRNFSALFSQSNALYKEEAKVQEGLVVPPS